MGSFIERFRVFFLISVMAIPLFVQGASGQSLVKGPYLICTGVNTEMMVLWQTNATASCRIEWGTSTGYGSSASATRFGDNQHKYTIGSLTPGTKYHYRVISSGESHTGSFRAPPPVYAGSVKMLAYGDTRSNPGTHDAVNAAMIAAYADDPDYQTITLLSGDWTSSDTESNWTDQFFGRSRSNSMEMQANLPIAGCRGNHEGSASNYGKYWPYPYEGGGMYWSFDYGPVHVAIIDQYAGYSPGSPQHTWLEADLAGSAARWKFILLHEPGWSAGSHGDQSRVRNYIQPLCETYGVSIVFAGHNHNYARAMVNGVAHITTGGGGAPLYGTSWREYVVALESVNHFCEIDIQGGNLTLTARRLDGSVIDVLEMGSGITELYVDDDAPNDPGPGDPSVSDPLEDGTAEHPFDTLNEAINWSGSDDTIFVEDGEYKGSSNRVDLEGKSITIKSVNGPENCSILDEIGIQSNNNQLVHLEGLTVVGNSSLPQGISILNSIAVLTNCRVVNCRDNGIYAYSSEIELINCGITGNQINGIFCRFTTAALKSCEIAFNGGEAAYGNVLYFDRCGPISIQNCTIFGNAMSGTREVINAIDSDLAIDNCIIRGHGLDPIRNDADSNVVVSYCDIEGGYTGGQGNIDVSALFVDRDAGDLRLLSVSPCIDAGDPGYVGGEDDFDFAGNRRVLYGRVDMGAFEMVSADFDLDGCVNMVDMGVFIANWPSAGCAEPDWCGRADLLLDGVVGLDDMLILIGDWMMDRSPAPGD